MIPIEGTKITLTFMLYSDGIGMDFCVTCDEALDRNDQLKLLKLIRAYADHATEMVLSTPPVPALNEAGR